MKKKDKIILIVVVSILLISTGLLSAYFLTREEPIAAAENKYQGTYNAYGGHEHDSYMNIDGKLDEEQWQNKSWYYNSGYELNGGVIPSMEVTAFPTEKGVYVAYKVKDGNIVYSGQKNMGKNSCFSINIVAYRDGERIGSKKDYQKSTLIDMGCDVKNFTDFDRAVVVDGKLNSGDTVGATLETFFAWESLNIDPAEGIPTEVGLVPEYYAILMGEESVRLIGATGVSMGYNSESSFIFDANGYCQIGGEGVLLGNAKNGHTKTPGWDLSKEHEGIVESPCDSAIELLFFKDMFAKNIIAETTIIPTSANTVYASLTRAGLAFMSESSVYGAACAVMRDAECSYETGVFSNIRLYTRIPSAEIINTTHNDTAYKNTSNKQGVKLTVIKYEDTYVYFMDGNFMGAEQMPSCAAEVYPALFTVGAGAIFKDYSCKEITEDDMISYLNKHNVYRIKTELASSGGSLTSSANFVKKNDSVDINIVTNKGYELESVLLNGKEKMSALKSSAVDGTITFDNVNQNQHIKVKFAKFTGTKHNLTISATADKTYSAELVITSKSNGLLSYRERLQSEKETNIELPAGTYTVKIVTDEYMLYTTQVNLNKDRTVSAKLKASMFPTKVVVNGKEISSNKHIFDVSKETEGKVSTSYDAGAQLAPLYFKQTAKDFVATTTVSYTTNFKEGYDYQPDLMGGFSLHDGSASTWVTAWKNGIKYRGLNTGSSRLTGLTQTTYLVYPNPISVEFTMAKCGNMVYFYYNGIYGGEIEYTKLGPKLDPNKEVAIGLVMFADKTADIEFSNYSLQTGEAAAKKYIDAHKPGSVPSKKLSANPLFAEFNTLGTKTWSSAVNNYNVTSDKVNGSYAMGSRSKTMWLYSEKGSSTALVSAKIRYSSDFKQNIEYQKDLFGGFSVASDKKEGWIMALQKGTNITGSQRDRNLVGENVLLWDGTNTPKDVTLTLAAQDRYIYVYFDGKLVIRYAKSAIVDGAGKDTKLIFGLRMHTDKTADIEFSDISYTEDANKVAEYISSHQ